MFAESRHFSPPTLFGASPLDLPQFERELSPSACFREQESQTAPSPGKQKAASSWSNILMLHCQRFQINQGFCSELRSGCLPWKEHAVNSLPGSVQSQLLER